MRLRHTCKLCNKSYSRNDSLKLHLRNVHNVEPKRKVYATEEEVCKHEEGMELLNRLFLPDEIKIDPNETLVPEQENTLSPLKFVSPDQLNLHLHQYWENFHPTFPILHRGTFVAPLITENNTLLHIMCAIGAKYDKHSKLLSDDCFAYCADILNKHLALENAGEVPVDVFQAGLLAGYTGLFWGSSHWYKWLSRSIYQLIMVARENGMFQHIPLVSSSDWKSFLELELMRRNSYALFFIDGQMSTLLNNPPKMSHYEIKHILPCHDDLWDATSEEEWSGIMAKLENHSDPGSGDDGLATSGQYTKHNLHAPGVYFLEALQQTLICGNAPSQTSSFGGMILLLAIHIMIRNMTQFAGLLETCYALAQDPYSRRSQLGNALDGLRFLIPRSPRMDINGRPVKGMWGLFEATLHLALIHLHLPDTAITLGIVEPDLEATIATAAALTQPQSIIPPGTAFLGNEIHKFPYETLALVTGHTTFFLKTFSHLYKETNPLLTFMFYKVSLVTWLVLRLLIQRTETTLAKEKRRLSSNSSAMNSPPDPKELRKEFMLKHLAVEILSHVELSDNFNDIACYENCMINRLTSFDTWGVGVCGAMSFKDMLKIGELLHFVRN